MAAVCSSMAAVAGVPSISLVSSSSSSSSSTSSSSFTRPSPSIKLRIPFSATTISLINSSFSTLLPLSNKKSGFELYSTVQEVAVEKTQEEETLDEETQEENKKKLYVVNLPYTFSVADMKSLFGECGTVKDVEIIKQKDGKNRGFAFVTMASGDEASAVIEKFNSYNISGRTIRVEFAKRFKRPSPPPPAGTPAKTRVETRKLYVSNLAWNARSTQLREFFSAVSNPVSARVVFDSPSGRSAGYGFVAFTTKEEAEIAISALNGKELMGRPVSLKLSEKNVDEPVKKPVDA